MNLEAVDWAAALPPKKPDAGRFGKDEDGATAATADPFSRVLADRVDRGDGSKSEAKAASRDPAETRADRGSDRAVRAGERGASGRSDGSPSAEKADDAKAAGDPARTDESAASGKAAGRPAGAPAAAGASGAARATAGSPAAQVTASAAAALGDSAAPAAGDAEGNAAAISAADAKLAAAQAALRSSIKADHPSVDRDASGKAAAHAPRAEDGAAAGAPRGGLPVPEARLFEPRAAAGRDGLPARVDAPAENPPATGDQPQNAAHDAGSQASHQHAGGETAARPADAAPPPAANGSAPQNGSFTATLAETAAADGADKGGHGPRGTTAAARGESAGRPGGAGRLLTPGEGIRSSSLRLAPDRSEARLSMRLDELGPVRLRVLEKNGELSVRVAVRSSHAETALSQSLADLAASLGRHDGGTARLEVVREQGFTPLAGDAGQSGPSHGGAEARGGDASAQPGAWEWGEDEDEFVSTDAEEAVDPGLFEAWI